ncbi:hypothetical protein M791_04975 [Neisseria gonorrhoeae MU_NG26]|nr:hypothetical protein M675_05670 [Neisseria gonorrhoeae SK1902]KLS04585.1 hypothetical protein M725_06995 [Neisseria gonorrhoeae ATL_2011_01_08]KLS34806.1 hypothetical protein M735_11845 [Neisseria gonorrhoeae MIA_2011_03-09]KLS52757.1 hypothetical protein M736_09905 [Neisseria gonorrhoeae MIA_2011_03-10]KLS86625.1 hypothetical protein M773_11065 [Neisseria gonorrhoeae MU_NG4]KLT05987.1 hypothetical protein M791_04975 [Neisseria gonorrhoeae MU_NG26]
MSMEIKFNTLGVILNGVNPEEKFIKIIDGQENTGGFLILLSSNDKFSSFDSYDDWVENLEILKEYLQESHWIIKWVG